MARLRTAPRGEKWFMTMIAATWEGSWLERKLSTMDALYRRFGREGLRDHSVADVGLLLSSKELQLRDAAKGRDLGEDQKAANRQLEMEVKDLTAYMKGQLAGVSLS